MGVGAAGLAVPRRLVAVATLGLSGLGLLLALAFLLTGAAPAVLALPLGTGLSLDGLAGFFMAALMAVGLAAAAAIPASAIRPPTLALVPVFLGLMALTLLAGDVVVFGLAFELTAIVALLLAASRGGDTASVCTGTAIVGAACLVPALVILAAGAHWDPRFAAIRTQPPDGWHAAMVLALALVGIGARAGLPPLHAWLPRAHAAASTPAAALLAGAMTSVAVFGLMRVILDLCGPAQPGWWGVPLLVLGAGGGVLGALRATMEADIRNAIACSTVAAVGLIAVGLGVALSARGADLPSLASLALGGALFATFAHALFKPLLVLAAGAVHQGAGTSRLERLGGLIHAMPRTTVCVLVGAASLACLPPASGFAGTWMLFQAVLGSARFGGTGLMMLAVLVAGAVALATALLATAAVRLVGIAFLGRPRSPRASAAEEPPFPLRAALIVLAAASALIGLFPGAVLTLADPALHRVLGGDMADRTGLLAVAAQADLPPYSAIGIALLLGLAAAGIVGLVRWRTLPGHRSAPAWDNGLPAPPSWLPFGDPLTQYGGAGFAQPLRHALGRALLRTEDRILPKPPGDPAPVRIEVNAGDPVERLLCAVAASVRDLAGRAQLRGLRAVLAALFAALVVALAIAALRGIT